MSPLFWCYVTRPDPEYVETMSNPRYTLELFIRVVTVNLETIKIVRALPKLDIAA